MQYQVDRGQHFVIHIRQESPNLLCGTLQKFFDLNPKPEAPTALRVISFETQI